MMFDREYYFYGKHADMVRKLTTNWNDKIGASVFERNLDVYEICLLYTSDAADEL